MICGSLMGLDWYFRKRPVEEAIAKEFPIGQEAIFTGVYRSRWESARFTWHKDGVIRESRDSRFNCQLIIPYENGWSWLGKIDGPSIFTTSKHFDLEFRGKIVGKGDFGHLGCCRYQIEVLEMLSARRHTEDSTSLLRGSKPPTSSLDELLHPTQGNPQTDPQELLRPDESENDR